MFKLIFLNSNLNLFSILQAVFINFLHFESEMKFVIFEIITTLFFLVIASNNSNAQLEISCDSMQLLQAKEKIKEAKQVISFKPLNARKYLEEALEIHPEYAETYYLLGIIDFNRAKKMLETNVENFKSAETYFLSAEKNFNMALYLDSTFNRYSVNYYLGEFHFNSKEYSNAQFFFKKYINNNNFSCDTVEMAQIMLTTIEAYYQLINNPVPFAPKPVQGICTKDDEYLPYISPDGKFLFFTHRYNRTSRFSNIPVSIEEFSFAERLNPLDHNLDKYTNGIAMETPFNQGNRDQGGVSITIDNKCLFITICSYIRTGNTSYKNCDIYSSDFIDGKWTPLKDLGPNINSDQTWEGQPSVTADGNGLFFASAREGGYGGIDIYRSKKDANGNWGKAYNLGSVINTKGDDKTPFVHTDSQTLYFSSNGHLGVGGFDIFYSNYLGNGNWGKPINLGYPINTDNDELAFIVSTNGQKIYFSSNKLEEGKGGWDIYSAPLYDQAKPQQVLFVNGKLSDELGKPLNNAEVELQNLKSLKLTQGLVDPTTGEYAIAMAIESEEDEFILTVKKQGYFYGSKYIKSNKKMLLNPPTTINFEILPIQVGAKIKLKDIYFDFNSSKLDEKSEVSLNNFAEFLTLNSTVCIEIFGHTDNVGSEEANLTLSQSRAEAVYDYLIAKGIESKRIKYTGLGESFPIASNSTKKGRDQNRRTEFVVTVK